jgi:serine/threonine-protein kinase
MNATVSGDLAGQVLGDRYRIERLLARGGMAAVYLATDLRLHRAVAIKVLRQDLAADPDFRDRFMREARATASLSHPNVVGLYDFHSEDDLAYLVLEYIPGPTLREVLGDQRLTPSQALLVQDELLQALVAAHEAGIVHRDIKPENLIVARRDTVKVADFGLARAMDASPDHRTRTGLVIGTAAYVSPEHVSGTGTDEASDIYSAGILLFEMLTGGPPFAGDNPLAVAYQHVNSDVPRPSSRVPDLPTELDDLVLGATARDPDDRFASAEDFLTAVRRVRALLPPAEPLPRPPVVEAAPTTVLVDGAADAAALVAADDDTTEQAALVLGGSGIVPVEPAPDPSNRRRKTLLLVGALAVLLIGGLAWAFVAGPLQRVTVPEVVGLTQEQATAALEAVELRFDGEAREHSETVPVGVVISQDPAAQASTFIQFTVRGVVSLGPERYAVPDLRGKSVEEASQALADTKLAVAGQTDAFDEEVPAGAVAGTDPPAGTSLKPQTPVTLIVSQGPAPRPVPAVVGSPEAQANAALAAAGLAVGSRTEDFSEAVPAGAVVSVTPAAGTEVEKGSAVALVISKGPPPVQVPRVVDLREAEAVAALQRVGLGANVQRAPVVVLGRVYSQDPAAGATVPKGTTVTIAVF